jgi:hypothetical protein
MEDVRLYVVAAEDQVAHHPPVVRYVGGDVEGLIEGLCRGDRVSGWADAANSLGDPRSVARIATLQNQLQPAEQQARAPGVLHLASVSHDLDLEVALDPSDRVYDDSGHVRPPCWASPDTI